MKGQTATDNRTRLVIVFMALFFFIISGYYNFYFHRVTRFEIQSYLFGINKSSGNSSASNLANVKLILGWTTFFMEEMIGGCPELNCTFTRDRSLINQADALVFHIRDMSSWDLPKWRNRRQRYVFWLMESPAHTYYPLKSLSNFFNLTMTYRRDSDVYAPYGYRAQTVLSPSPKLQLATVLVNKTKFAVWVVSNCETHSRREILMQTLQKHLDIDVWGECGNASACPVNNNSQCLQLMHIHYKFVFALENSVCKDYVTEKYWSRASLNIIPIVLNRTILAPFAPENSFIAVDDFNNLQEMVHLLKEVDGNDTKYMHYIMAKYEQLPKPICHSSKPKGWCGLCQQLHAVNNTKSYSDIFHWWHVQGDCFNNIAQVDAFFSLP